MNGAQNDYFIDDPEIGIPLAEHIAGLGGMLAFHIARILDGKLNLLNHLSGQIGMCTRQVPVTNIGSPQNLLQGLA